MTNGVLRTSAIALGAAAFAMLSTLPAADAATAVHHYGHVAHGHVAHARVAHGHVYGHVARARANWMPCLQFRLVQARLRRLWT